MPDTIYRVLPQQKDQTVAACLRQWLPESSWGQIHRLLKSRQVMINGNLCVDAGRRLKLQDVIKVLPHPAEAPPKADDLVIRHLDEHVVVVEKPFGVTSNRHKDEQEWPARRKQIQPTLDEMLRRVVARMDPRLKKRKGVPPPVRSVHRLDRDTSGLMVYARTVRAERHLGEQFRSHTTQRHYIAIVHGSVQAQTITSRLVRDRGDGRRGSTEVPNVGKIATTHIRPIDQLPGYTMIECRLETGRTHQIRIHLSELGHPVCGDKVYFQSRFGKPIADSSRAPRLALHAAELGFVHPMTEDLRHFTMPLPPDLKQFWDRLRG